MGRFSPTVAPVGIDYGGALSNALQAFLSVREMRDRRARQDKADARQQEADKYEQSQRPLNEAVRAAHARDLGVVPAQVEDTGDPSQSLQARYGNAGASTLGDALRAQSPSPQAASVGAQAIGQAPSPFVPSRMGSFDPRIGGFTTSGAFAMPGAGSQAPSVAPRPEPNVMQQYGTQHVHGPGVSHLSNDYDLDPSQSKEGRHAEAAAAQRQREGRALAAALGNKMPAGVNPDDMGSLPPAVLEQMVKGQTPHFEKIEGPNGAVSFFDPQTGQTVNSGLKARLPQAPVGTWQSVPQDDGTVVFYNPQTGETRSPGLHRAAPPHAPSEGERAAAGLLPEVQEAGRFLAQHDDPKMLAALAKRGGIFTNWANSDEGRQYNQAATQYIQNVIYAKSGKAITEEEAKRLYNVYIGMPGDDEATLGRKRQARSLAEQGIIAIAGRAAPKVGAQTHDDVMSKYGLTPKAKP